MRYYTKICVWGQRVVHEVLYQDLCMGSEGRVEGSCRGGVVVGDKGLAIQWNPLR